MKKSFFIPAIVILFFSCSENEEKTIWVYPYRLNKSLPPYAEPGLSLLIQESEELNYSKWNLKSESFEIKGFIFEEGYFYKLRVKVEENTPLEKIKLKSVLEKKKDFVSRIEGNWQNISVPEKAYFPMVLVVNKLNRTKIDVVGCFTGLTGLGEVGERKIQLADKIYRLDVDKICLGQSPIQVGDMSFFNSTSEYQISSEGYLEFFDEAGNLLTRFRRLE